MWQTIGEIAVDLLQILGGGYLIVGFLFRLYETSVRDERWRRIQEIDELERKCGARSWENAGYH